MANIKLTADVLNNRISNQEDSCCYGNNITTGATNFYNYPSINTTSGWGNGNIYIQHPKDSSIKDFERGFNDIEKVINNEEKTEDINEEEKKNKTQIEKVESKIIEINKKLKRISTNIGVKKLNIKDIKFDNKNDILFITFADGDTQKAIKDNGDEMDLDTAILLCICKHIMHGQSNMYKIIKYINNIIELNDKKDMLKKLEENRIKERKQKNLKRKQEREKRRREERIQEMEEAYLRALSEFNRIEK